MYLLVQVCGVLDLQLFPASQVSVTESGNNVTDPAQTGTLQRASNFMVHLHIQINVSNAQQVPSTLYYDPYQFTKVVNIFANQRGNAHVERETDTFFLRNRSNRSECEVLQSTAIELLRSILQLQEHILISIVYSAIESDACARVKKFDSYLVIEAPSTVIARQNNGVKCL